MRLCFPVLADKGVKSAIYGHFASTPFFAIIDTETRQSTSIANCDPDEPFAGCNPFAALHREALDGVVVDGAGDESVRVMNLCGFKVFLACSASVAENIAMFETDCLPELAIQGSQLEGRCDSGEDGSMCDHNSH